MTYRISACISQQGKYICIYWSDIVYVYHFKTQIPNISEKIMVTSTVVLSKILSSSDIANSQSSQVTLLLGFISFTKKKKKGTGDQVSVHNTLHQICSSC